MGMGAHGKAGPAGAGSLPYESNRSGNLNYLGAGPGE